MELGHLNGFQDFMRQHGCQMPEDYPEQEVLRNLHATGWDYNQTYVDIVAQLEWRS